jgi:preprotein translocase subunit SecE
VAKGDAHGGPWRDRPDMSMANPFEFIQEVRTEAGKVTWPTRRETMITTVMVLIMVVLAAVFFVSVDGIIHFVVSLVLGYRNQA